MKHHINKILPVISILHHSHNLPTFCISPADHFSFHDCAAFLSQLEALAQDCQILWQGMLFKTRQDSAFFDFKQNLMTTCQMIQGSTDPCFFESITSGLKSAWQPSFKGGK